MMTTDPRSVLDALLRTNSDELLRSDAHSELRAVMNEVERRRKASEANTKGHTDDSNNVRRA